MTAQRIYYVRNKDDAQIWLVTASSAAQAIRHVTQPYEARVASQSDLVRLLGQGIKVEKAGDE